MSLIQKPRIAQLILAAGASTRMGEPKQLFVLGANYQLIYDQIEKYPVKVVENKNWSLGMGSSIQIGVNTILQSEEAFDAILISLIDQPLIKTKDYGALIEKFESKECPIVASDLGDRIGVPAIFSKPLFEELRQLEKDYGARYIIEKYKNQTEIILLNSVGVDVDTMQQYRQIIKSNFLI